MLAMEMSAQEVPTFFPRKFLLEHFTSANCNQCPMGMKYIVEYLGQQTTPYIWVSHHAVYGEDEYTITESNRLAQNFRINSVPTMMINRTEHDGVLLLKTSSFFDLSVQQDTLAEASVVIEHTFNKIARQLNVTVSGQVANQDVSQYLLTVLVKENRLVGKQEDSFYSWKQVPWAEYMHPRVVRAFLTAPLGDTVQVTNQAYEHTVSYKLNKDWVPENCCIVAYLTSVDKQPVINAEQVPVIAGTQGGEQYGPYGITEARGPNTNVTFDSLQVKKMADDLLEVQLFSSKTINTPYMGICKQVGFVQVRTETDVLQAGTYNIVDSNEQGSIVPGYRIDEEETLGGSRLIYALSTDLKNGIITPIHMWRMSSGEMVLDEEGNISLNFTTYNGTIVTATAKYDFVPATTGLESLEVRGSGVQKVLRNGQLLIEKLGECYNILGYKVSE